jgi:hypothetical protein
MTTMATPPSSQLLQKWLTSINQARLKALTGTAHVDVLADAHRATVNALISDPGVQQAIEQAQARAITHAEKNGVAEVVKSMLVDASWLHKLLTQHLTSPSGRATAGTRTDKLRDLKSAAAKASRLAKDITSLLPVTGRALTLKHLISRQANGNPNGFIASRKGWGSAIVSRGPSISELLVMLASDLKEEADLLKCAMSKNRQTGGGLRGFYPLIDALCKKSVQLGNRDSSGAPCPDFRLVHALLTSLKPNSRLDESTLRARWNRQRKLKQKTP